MGLVLRKGATYIEYVPFSPQVFGMSRVVRVVRFSHIEVGANVRLAVVALKFQGEWVEEFYTNVGNLVLEIEDVE